MRACCPVPIPGHTCNPRRDVCSLSVSRAPPLHPCAEANVDDVPPTESEVYAPMKISGCTLKPPSMKIGACRLKSPVIGSFDAPLMLPAANETPDRNPTWKLRRAGGLAQEAYYRVRPIDRALIAAVYLSLVALLVVGMHATLVARTLG